MALAGLAAPAAGARGGHLLPVALQNCKTQRAGRGWGTWLAGTSLDPALGGFQERRRTVRSGVQAAGPTRASTRKRMRQCKVKEHTGAAEGRRPEGLRSGQ
jgi:hypothetical protein